MNSRGHWGLTFLGLCSLMAALPVSGEAQDLSALISSCGGSSQAQMSSCQSAALSTQAAQGALGLTASGGTDLPGSASTVGWRTKGSPRFAISLWGSVSRAPIPALRSGEEFPQGETSATFPSVHVSGTVGLFDGFSLGPTIGGFGSIDLTASTQWIRTPRDHGFAENNIGWGIGTRIGILRESFSLPGISLSAFYRSLGNTELGNIQEGDPMETGFDLGVTSFRGVVGKDLWGMGFFGGAGWDRYASDADLMVAVPSWGSFPSMGSGELRSDRFLFFAGGSLTYLTLQIAIEAGWAEGFDPTLPISNEGSFDPSSGSEFGALSFRVTF